MQGNQVGFESSLQQHLDTEQRRAVLEAIGGSINPDSTLGEIIDAAEALGWSEKMGDLSLADLAEALLAPNGESAAPTREAAVKVEADDDGSEDEVDASDDDDADEDDDDADEDDDDADDGFELEIEEPAPSRRKPGKAAAAKQAKAAASTKKKAAASKKVASKKVPEPEPARGSKKTAKKVAAGKPGKKAAEAPAPARGRGAEKSTSPANSKKTAKKAAASRRKPTAVDVDDRMSLDEAAEFFLPVVEEIGEATMQALEEQTGVSRRKLRFHVGQLVKHGYLERHGMGRGTYYTRR